MRLYKIALRERGVGCRYVWALRSMASRLLSRTLYGSAEMGCLSKLLEKVGRTLGMVGVNGALENVSPEGLGERI